MSEEDANLRRAGRRNTDPALSGAEEIAQPRSNLPAITEKSPRGEPSAATFEAQLIGQDGQKRGLRGGQPVLEKARRTYLGAEFSGKADRRPPKGLFSKSDV